MFSFTRGGGGDKARTLGLESRIQEQSPFSCKLSSQRGKKKRDGSRQTAIAAGKGAKEHAKSEGKSFPRTRITNINEGTTREGRSGSNKLEELLGKPKGGKLRKVRKVGGGDREDIYRF